MKTDYEIQSAIRNHNSNVETDVCMRFANLNATIWISADEVSNAGSVIDYLEETIGLTGDEISRAICMGFYVIDATGVAGIALTSVNAVSFMKWDDYPDLVQFAEDHGYDTARAGYKGLGIPADKLSEAYHGQYRTFAKFVEEYFNEHCMHEIPEQYRNLIDYERYIPELDQSYHFCDGYVFSALA